MHSSEPLDRTKQRLAQLGFHGLVASWDEARMKPWLDELISVEKRERQRRSLERRVRNAKVGPVNAMSDFDWTWPRKIDREATDSLRRPEAPMQYPFGQPRS